MNNIKTELKEVLSLEDLDITEKTTIKDVLNAYNSREDTTIKEAVGNMSFENDDADDEYLFPTIVVHRDEEEAITSYECFAGKSPNMLAVINDGVYVNWDTGETAPRKSMSLYEPLVLGAKYFACTRYDNRDQVGDGYLYELDENNYPQNIRNVRDISIGLQYGGGTPYHTVSPGVPDPDLPYTLVVTENFGETELYNDGIYDSNTMNRINRGINALVNRNMYDGGCSFKVYYSDKCVAWLMKGSNSVTFDDQDNKYLTNVNPTFETVVYESTYPWGDGGLS